MSSFKQARKNVMSKGGKKGKPAAKGKQAPKGKQMPKGKQTPKGKAQAAQDGEGKGGFPFPMKGKK